MGAVRSLLFRSRMETAVAEPVTSLQVHDRPAVVPRREKLRGWRRIACAVWGAPRDPQIYCSLDVDATPLLGVDASPFGSAMVSSVGMFGLPNGFSPIAWLYHVPILVLAGELAEKPVAVDGKVEIRPVLPICVSLDHRYLDGWHIGRLTRAFREYLTHPERFEPAV